MTNRDYYLRFARDMASWLLSEFAERHRSSPSTPPAEILARLTELRLGRGTGPAVRARAAESIEPDSCLLETTVHILRQQGLWPADSRTAQLCYAEIVTAIREAAPASDLPWEALARPMASE